MNTIFSLAHFCEIHGPVNLFCTQALSSISSLSSPSAPALSAASSSSHLPPPPPPPPAINPSATLSSNTASQPANISAKHPAITTSTSSKAACASCSFTLPRSLAGKSASQTRLRTEDSDVSYISLRHPADQERYKVLRSACIRALSCELLPGRTGPVFFGDASMGYTIAYLFRLPDPTARGGKRRYAFMCTTTDELYLLQAWTFIVTRFKGLVQRIRSASKSALRNEPSEESIGDRTFLRRRESARVSEKALSDLLDMDDIFLQLHACFSWMLGIWREHYEGAETGTSALSQSRGATAQV